MYPLILIDVLVSTGSPNEIHKIKRIIRMVVSACTRLHIYVV
jgi:hypothetical protein